MPHKFAIVIPDGAADEPLDALGGRTPLQAARTPEMDAIAREGVLGRSRNVPDRFLPGSDVATLSLFGYDPEAVFTGRAPLEAAAAGVALGPDDWAVRCNLMTIRDGRLSDFTAGHITSEEGSDLDRCPPGKARAGRDRVLSRRQLPEPDDLPGLGPAGPVRRRHLDHPAPRPARPAGRRLPAQGDGLGVAPRTDRRRGRGGPRSPGQPAIGWPEGSPPPTRSGSGVRGRPRDCPSSRCSTA